ncbi:MAG: CDP-alcohol phosphatidyltransferase family protein [Candidatus Bathyarchaeia archaeon]
MKTIKELRNRFNKYENLFLKFFASKINNLGLSPTQVSLIGFIFAFFSTLSYFMAKSNDLAYYLAPSFLLLSGFFDALDGAIARLYFKVSKLGGFLDSVIDRLGEAMVYSALILSNLANNCLGLIALILSFMVSYTRARAEVEGIDLKSIGIGQRALRLMILAISSFLKQIEIGLVLIIFFAFSTLIKRVIFVYKELH